MYTVRKNPPKEVQNALQKYDIRTQRLLYARNITTQEEAEAFFKKEWIAIETQQYKNIKKAVGRILDAVEKEEMIGIFSDYDCDGIPAAAALYTTLHALGHRRITYYVPDRNSEGFGLNKKGIKKMAANNASVVCVLDCGTASPEEVADMEQKGMHTIIIDHHLADETEPNAFAMINPTVEGVEQPHPCAAGVTYIVIQEIIREAQRRENIQKPPIGWEKWQLDIVGLATLSDMVPLRGINRQLAHYGLQVLRKSPRPGIQALCDVLRLDQQKVTQDDLSFLIIPRINAASRMGGAETAFKLLTTSSTTEAAQLARTLTELNNKRKTAVATMTKAAQKQAESKGKEKAVWVFGNREWKPSLVGLVAQKIAETYRKTVFVWGQGGTEEKAVIKGSCRSKEHNVFSLMKNTPEVFTEAGGHKQAGGFTLAHGAEVSLEDALNQTASKQEQEVSAHEMVVDNECTISEVADVYKLYEQFAPFGVQNEVIRIAIPQCTIHKKSMFGKKKEHVRYTLTDGTGYLDGIAFFAKENKEVHAEPGQTLRAVVGCVEMDTYRRKIQIRVIRCIP
ncbi:MAG: single-stranded-DNA-specific exonuclease RecJ [Candidatus Kaiserbacteria bacterium]|nr:single-stranded-DNA-specific exonuclease RecJ [Candidatus Kaiserbacteria bacterium]